MFISPLFYYHVFVSSLIKFEIMTFEAISDPKKHI